MRGFWRELGIEGPELDEFWEKQSLEGLHGGRGFYKSMLQDLHHMLVVGPTGTGKSKFAEGVIRHLLRRRDAPSVVLLDPGGETAKAVARYALENGHEQRTIIMDPEQDQWHLGFNPLKRVKGMSVTQQAKYIQESILVALQIDQRDSVFYMPVLEQVLFHLAYVLIEAGLTMNEAQYLLSSNPHPLGRAIVARSQSPEVQQFWTDLASFRVSQREQLLGLARARLLPFLASEAISGMLSQQERALDFSEILERGGLFVCNLEAGSHLNTQDSRLLANLLIGSVVKACFSRPANTGRPVYLFIEECGEGLIGTEIGKTLRRARKQGLKVILLNQDVSSMMRDNPVVFWQIWSNTTHKVAFGDLPFSDLQVLAMEFFGEALDLKEVKEEIFRTYFEPLETTRPIDAYSKGQFTAAGQVETAAMTTGQVFAESGGLLSAQALLRLHQSHSTGQARSSSSGQSSGSSHTVVPFYEHLERQELSSRTFWSIEELLHQAQVRMKALAKRQVALKRRGQPAQFLKVPLVKDTTLSDRGHQARNAIFQESGLYAKLEDVKAEQAKRTAELAKAVTLKEPKYRG